MGEVCGGARSRKGLTHSSVLRPRGSARGDGGSWQPERVGLREAVREQRRALRCVAALDAASGGGRLIGPRLAALVAQQHAALAVRVESERLALPHESVQRCLGDGILTQRLHGAPQRARAVRGRVPALDDGVREGGREVERDLHLVGAAALQLRQVELRHLGHFGAGERLEDDHLVQPIEQLRPEARRHLSPHRAAHGLVAAAAAAAAARDLEDLL
mmetsp:Transcript_1564/g.4998  ORF Transcript_1564/g.4998 Transcript_1564/m.4998 type:complete len:217 (-) Transcript_1564:2072-2722(-)